MNDKQRLLALAVVLAAAVAPRLTAADTVHAAVAANFTGAANEIGSAFAAATGHEVMYSFGATGQLYAQITQGAPFDVFLAADRERPGQAEREGYAVPGSRFTYATGAIVLYSADPALVSGADTLRRADFTRLAIANPATAPYGHAAIEALKALGVYEALAGRIVQGNNIAQVYQFVATGNAELGFVAQAQVAIRDGGSRWPVPSGLYPAIAQDAVLLNSARGNEAARAFLDFLRGDAAREIKSRYGYGPGN